MGGKVMSGEKRVQVNRWSRSFAGVLMLAIVLSGCQQSPSGNLEAQVLEIIRENPEVILESVQAYQQEQQRSQQESRGAVVQQMRENSAQFIGDSPVKGAAAQDIVMIEFSDFQCPFCARASGTVAEFIEKHGDRVTLVFKHLPLVSINPQSLPAARASWAAQQQGQFWEYHQALFENQERLGESLYLEIAEDLNLDLEQFERDRQSEAAIAAVQTDLELADQLGLTGTPTFFINGEPFTGAVPLEEMEAVLAQVTGESS